ncbi:uncharacterized protein PITG_13711 [Phytophthora infestans T30-4]|uniref:Uncharacterized protein n=1 Tax=Phytophthora infestans (strain T30-4) TaxID=403677 RepID=D0NML5_PHYIT|nr:uncharacterized protein PITG_13711 [Phytophthora infestans T30-4]EEY61772.1 hypothetical protein PITG_13711 [Phytophthora infestans T30-4]|eukprot:XP_002899412.1 hypothetical protein PITG_13711 [Phytophthora infestans T30-4]
MDDDEDTYGFGTFADLFDTAPAQAAKRLDLGALSRFCMPERLLSRFEQQQRRDQNIARWVCHHSKMAASCGYRPRSRTRTRWNGAKRSYRTSRTARTKQITSRRPHSS